MKKIVTLNIVHIRRLSTDSDFYVYSTPSKVHLSTNFLSIRDYKSST